MADSKAVTRLCAVAILALFSASASAAERDAQGYLQADAFHILRVLPPAPVKGDPRYQADRAIFKATQKLYGTPRWDMATNDVKTGAADMMRDFRCALGVSLTPDNAPRLLALVQKAGRDTGRGTGIAKQYYKRLRPFQIDNGKTCEPKEDVAHNFDYPSGHTTWGWTWALILAELAPDRADAILARGRAFGESRIVCGVHNASAVEAGRLSASSTLAAVRATAGYRTDFAAAEQELTALRNAAAAEKPTRCTEEDRLIAQDIVHAGNP